MFKRKIKKAKQNIRKLWGIVKCKRNYKRIRKNMSISPTQNARDEEIIHR